MIAQKLLVVGQAGGPLVLVVALQEMDHINIIPYQSSAKASLKQIVVTMERWVLMPITGTTTMLALGNVFGITVKMRLRTD